MGREGRIWRGECELFSSMEVGGVGLPFPGKGAIVHKNVIYLGILFAYESSLWSAIL